MELFHKMISAALNIEKQINNTLNLLKDGATILLSAVTVKEEVTGGWTKYR